MDEKTVDPRYVPTYDPSEIAHYLRLPVNTVANWAFGHKTFRPVLSVPNPKIRLLSFINVVEVHVLSAIRRQHNISLQNARAAMGYLKKEFREPHPLAMIDLYTTRETTRRDIFFKTIGRVVNASRFGQFALEQVLETYLQRIERAPDNSPLILYPFVAGRPNIHRKPVMFDPQVSFGRLVIANTGIPTAEVAHRFQAGEKISELARDYERDPLEIEDAIRCEFELEAA